MTTTFYVEFLLLVAAAVGLIVFVRWLDMRDDRRYGRVIDRLPQPQRGPNRRR